MNKIILQNIILLLFFVQLKAQVIKQIDSTYTDNKIICFSHLSFGKYSRSKPVKVFTCLKKDLITCEKKIIKCYKDSKVDFTEFYLIPLEKGKPRNNDKIIQNVITKIDKIRMVNNLSTIQIVYKELYDPIAKNIKITYDHNKIIELNKIKNLHQNVRINQMCDLMKN